MAIDIACPSVVCMTACTSDPTIHVLLAQMQVQLALYVLGAAGGSGAQTRR